MRARLIRERIEAGETADLGRLDGRLEEIATSGRRLRERLSRLASEVPRDAWLTAYAEGGANTSIVGKATSLGSIATLLANDRALRLVRVTRVEDAARALLEFTVERSDDAEGH